MKVYQVITVSKAYGFTNIIPSPFVFLKFTDVFECVTEQEQVFHNNQEPANYKGILSSLDDIAYLCKANIKDIDVVANDMYIYELEVKE